MINEKCRYCDSELRPALTTFTVVKDVIAYVVKGVPCLECPDCEEVIFDQDTAKKLSQYTSGKILTYRKPLMACVFHWDDPLDLAGQQSLVKTDNRPIVASVGTEKVAALNRWTE